MKEKGGEKSKDGERGDTGESLEEEEGDGDLVWPASCLEHF